MDETNKRDGNHDDYLDRIEDLVKQLRKDIAKRRGRENQRNRRRALNTLKGLRATIPDIKDGLTIKEIEEAQAALGEIVRAINSLQKDSEKTLQPVAAPGSPM
jgi:hypothetical protein